MKALTEVFLTKKNHCAHLLYAFVLCLLPFNTNAQYYKSTGTSPSVTSYPGGQLVTVIGSGNIDTTTWCDASPYWIGSYGGGYSGFTPDTGWYSFTFSKAIVAVRILVTAMDSFERDYISINGTNYILTEANRTPLITSCNQCQAITSAGSLACLVHCTPQPAGSYNFGTGGQLDIVMPSGFNSITVSTNGVQAGNVFSLYFTSTIAQNNGPLCVGDTLKLTGITASPTLSSFLWYGPNGFNSTLQNPIKTNISYADSGVYTLVVTTGLLHDTATTRVIVKPKAGISLASNTPLCSGDTIKIFSNPAASGYSFSWTGPNGFSSASQNPIVPNCLVADSGRYKLVASLNGCKSSDSTTVVVRQKPAPPITVSPINYCQNQTTAALSATGTNLKWYTTPTGGTGSSTAPVPSTTSAGTLSYYVSQTINSCESNRAIVVINITAKPNAPIVSSPVNYCQNETPTQLTATGSNLLWYTTSTGGTGTSSAPTPSTLATGTFQFYASQTANGCESDRAAITVNVSAAPTPPTVTTPIVFCQNQSSAPLAATGTNLLWYTTPGGGTGSSIAPTPNTSILGNTTYYVSQSFGNCESGRSSISVSVVTKPNPPTANTPVNYCQFATATALTATGTNLLWYTVPVGGSGSITSPVPSTAASGSLTYYVSQTINGCESDRTAITVNISAKPAPPGVSNVGYCQSGVAVPLSATGNNLLWYTVPTGGSGLSTAPIPSTSASGTTNYYVSQTINSCESDRAIITVSVTSQPNSPVVNAVTYCQFDIPSPLSATGNSLLWYMSATGGVGITVAPSVSTITPGTTSYYVTQTVNGCESNRALLSVTINAKPAIPVTSNVNYCQFDNILPLSANGSNLLWYTALSGGAGTANAPVPGSSNTGNQYYYVSQTVNGCESDRATIIVSINPKPNPPITDTALNYCQFDAASQLLAQGQNLKWYIVSTGGTPLTTAPIPNTSTSGSYHYYVSQTVNGCESNRRQINISIVTKPAPPTVVTPVVFCQHDAAAALTAIGQNLKWYTTPTGGIASSSAPLPNTTLPDTLTWWVTQSLNGCESDRTKLEAHIYSTPKGEIFGSGTIVCQHGLDTLWFFGNASVGTIINWTIPFGATLVQQLGRDTIILRLDSAGVASIRMYADNHSCRSAETIFNIYVRPVAHISIISDREVCVDIPSRVELSYGNINISNFQWDFDGGNTIYGTAGGPYLIKWPSAGIFVISATALANQCPAPKTYDTITVHELPDAHISFETYSDKNPICAGDSIKLTASTIQNDTTGNKYLWLPKNFFNEGRGADSTKDMVMARANKTGYIFLQLTNRYGCKNRDSVYVNTEPCCNVALPDAFTPNGDGKNDFFRMITIGHHNISTFRVVNRWGQTIFETVDETRGWDGNYGEKAQEAGTYFYYLKYQCENKEYYEMKGEVMLIR